MKSYDQPRQHIKKQRHYFDKKGPSSQSYGFSSSHVCMWELDYKENWQQRIDAFEPWCWRRLLRVSWTERRSNQSILEEISPKYSLERLMVKLKLQYFSHLMRTDSLEKTLMLGKIEGGKRRDNREWEGWMASWTQWTWAWISSRSWWWTGKPGVLQYMGSQRAGHNWATELNWLHLKISPWIAQWPLQDSFPDCDLTCQIQPVHSKGDQSWVFIGRTDAKAEIPILCLATSCEELTHWKRLWCWEGSGAGREGDDRGWDGWMVSLTRWTWVWVNSRGWWWTGSLACCNSWCRKESDTTEQLIWSEY